MAQESGFATPEEMRGKALGRLAVAGVITTAALGALWWLDQSGSDRSLARKSIAKPAPITSAPAPSNAPPQEEALPPGVIPAASPPTEAPAARADASPPPVIPAGAAAPPVPRVNNAPVAPVSRPSALPAPAAATPPPAAPVAEVNHFVVQVGIFQDPKAAQEMVRKLTRLGIRARLETRVQVGPFPSKAEADKAQEALRKQGFTGVVEIPAKTPTK